MHIDTNAATPINSTMETPSKEMGLDSARRLSQKRVSFQDKTQLSFQKVDANESNNVEISELFPNLELPKGILKNHSPEAGYSGRLSLSPISDRSRRYGHRKSTFNRRSSFGGSEPGLKRPRKPLLPSEEPEETLAQTLLRSMGYRDAQGYRDAPSRTSNAARCVLPKIHNDSPRYSSFDSPEEDERMSQVSKLMARGILPPKSSQNGILPPKSSQNGYAHVQFQVVDRAPPLPEISSTPRDNNVVKLDRICGLCRRNTRPQRKRKPAAAFCKYCDEYLCSDCVYEHRGKLTRLHPLLVFRCQTCKEMNIMNRIGSGYCVKCKFFFCSICSIGHCVQTNHDVLEGRDLLDVADAMTGKKYAADR